MFWLKMTDLFPSNLSCNSLQCFSGILKTIIHGSSQVERGDTDQLQCFHRQLLQNKQCHPTETQHSSRTLLLSQKGICPLSESSNYRFPKVLFILTATIYLTFPGNITSKNCLCNSSTGTQCVCTHTHFHIL